MMDKSDNGQELKGINIDELIVDDKAIFPLQNILA